MARNKKTDKTLLLKKNKNINCGSSANSSHILINNNNCSNNENINSNLENNNQVINNNESDSLNNLLLASSSTMNSIVFIVENDWIDTVSRYGGKTKKRKDNNGNWEYHSRFVNGKTIKERVQEIKVYSADLQHIIKKICFTKHIIEKNGENRFYLIYVDDETKKIINIYKYYLNENSLWEELDRGLDLNTFTKMSRKLSWYETISIWSSNIFHDSKKILQGIGYLSIVIAIKTIQRAFTVIVSSDGEIDWNKMVKRINPVENPIEFGLTLPQLMISVLAIDTWKWGLLNIFNEINKFRTRAVVSLQTTNSENNINIVSNYCKNIIKLVVAKLGYWIPNHLVITCASMYTVKSLTNFSTYWTKLKSGLNILSTFIRAEVLSFTSEFLRNGLTKFSETYLYTNIKNYLVNLCKTWFTNQTNNGNNDCSPVSAIFLSLLKIVTYSIIMMAVTVADNASKTAVVMWTANKWDEFGSTFVTWDMALIILGLISIDTFGNKYCNVKAKQEWFKLWNTLKSSCFVNVDSSTNNLLSTIMFDESTISVDLQNNEVELLKQYVEIEAKNINLNIEEYHNVLVTQSRFDTNEINESEPSTSIDIDIYHSHLNI